MFRILFLAIPMFLLSACFSLSYADVGDILDMPDGACGEVTKEQIAGQGEDCANPIPIPEQPPGVTFTKDLVQIIHYPDWSWCYYKITWKWTIPVPCPPPPEFTFGPPLCALHPL